MFHDKRGISPLIATVLLIGFTVALIILLIIWGKNYIEERTQKDAELSAELLKCSNLEFEVVNVMNDAISVRNTGSVDIKGFVFAGIEEDIDPAYVTIPKGGSGEVPFTSAGGIDELKLIPALRLDMTNAPLVPCSNKLKVIAVTN